DWSSYGFWGYMRGPKIAVADVIDFLANLDVLRDSGMSILLLCHTNVTPFRNPEGADYDRYTPALDVKNTWPECHKWADMILFGARPTTVVKARNNDTKGKAQGGQQRILYTDPSAAYD